MARIVVQWTDLEPGRYEDMVAALLSLLHPRSVRVDGSGGDRGRDVYFDTPAGPEVFQLKFFNGRMTPNRRQQVKRSLGKVVKHHEPASWALVVPIDPTPKEREWFDRLVADFPFPCEWHGRTWLEARIAGHPALVTYYEEGNQELVRQEVRKVLDGMNLPDDPQDAAGHVARVAARLDAQDPHYHFEVVAGRRNASADPPADAVLSVRIGDHSRIDVFEAYPGASEKVPIGGDIRFEFPDGEQDAGLVALRRHIDYGSGATLEAARVTLDAPGGLGGTFDHAEVRLGRAAPDHPGVPVEHEVLAEAVDDDGSVAATATLRLAPATAGQKYLVLAGTDAQGHLHAEIEVPLREEDAALGKVSFAPRFRDSPAALAVMPVVEFLEALVPPRTLQLSMPGVPEVDGPMMLQKIEEPVFPEHRFFWVRALASIERDTGASFALPEQPQDEELRMVLRAERLRRGERIRGTWTQATLETEGKVVERSRAAGNDGAPLTIAQTLTLHLYGAEVEIGRVVQEFASARLADPDAPADGSIRLLPGPDDAFVEYLDPGAPAE